MEKDVYLRILFIPLLGLGIPYVSGIINYALYSVPEMVAACTFFILTSFVIWTGSSWMHKKLRQLFGTASTPFTKMAAVISANALFGASIGGLSALTWYRFSRESFRWDNVSKFVAICLLAVVVFTLLYEILFLSKEREQDFKLVKKMDRELTQAELTALTNEMDPHFIFNSLNAMNHLILNNPTQAHLFNNHLAQVYKYFLLNKNRKLIPLQDELEFISSYFFLLEIRYDRNIGMQLTLGEHEDVMIPPCAMQILIENAIKHNEFSDTNPLYIRISMNGEYLKVTNKTKLKSYPHNSTNIGLKNLSLRFKLICQREIIIESNQDNFTVKLPLIKQSKKVSHDQSNYY
jgi:hypothetical protein